MFQYVRIHVLMNLIKKIDIINNTCIESCIGYGFKYEYNNLCFNDCPNDLDIFCNEDYNIINTSELLEYTKDSIILKEYSYYHNMNSLTNIYQENSISNLVTNKYSTSFVLINNENITQKIIKTFSNVVVIYECEKGDNINNNCNFLNTINNTEIMNIIKDNIKSIYDPETGKSQIIKGEDSTIFQITSAKNEKELLQSELLNNQNISILDLGNCEIKLKKEYNIKDSDSLIYLKQENTNGKASEKNIKYEIYEPYNFTKLNLSICNDETINLYIKIDLSGETKATYEI